MRIIAPAFKEIRAERKDRLGKNGVLIFIKRSHPPPEFHHDLTIGLCLPGWIGSLVAPLHPAAGIGNGPLFLHGRGTRKHKDFRFYLLGIHTRPFPESGGLVVKEVYIDQPVQFAQGLSCLTGICTRDGRVLTPGKKTLKLAFVHGIEKVQPGIGSVIIYLRHPAVTEIVFNSGRLTEHGL